MQDQTRPTEASVELTQATGENTAASTSHTSPNQVQEAVPSVSSTGNETGEKTETRQGQPSATEPSPQQTETRQNAQGDASTNTPQGKATPPPPPIVNPMDHHANERTFNSWQRTSAAYLVIGIALAKFFKGLTAIAGFIFFLIGCVIVVFAAVRFEAKRKHIDKFEYPAETVGPWIVTLCTIGVGVLSLAALWLGGKPLVIKNGRLFF